jgi:tetratricopeptide (TPR) repeat protein
MSTNRLDLLKSMLDQDPNSAFARYGLAMEFVNRGENELAVAEFEKLITAHPDYVAGYYHGGRALEKLGRIDEARAVFEKGIKAATRKGDDHARSELQAALDMVGL